MDKTEIKNKKVFICIPTYNEAENIAEILKQINDVVNGIHDYQFSIIIIDDNSPDGTKKIVEDYIKTRNLKNIVILSNSSKVGLAKAYIKGFKYSKENGADILITMDSDGSHNPKYITLMLDKLSSYDYIAGSRYIKGSNIHGWSLIRKLVSQIGNMYTKIILGVYVQDFTGGFNCFRSEVLNKVDVTKIKSTGYAFQIEFKYKTFRSGYKLLEYPIEFRDRIKGKSKFNLKIFREALIMPWRLKFSSPRQNLSS